MTVSSDPPKYIIVRDSIVESIMSDQLSGEDRLAPIAKMSVHFGVSPSVIQKALNQLVDEGFVECRGSRGYYVCSNVKDGNRSKKTEMQPQEKKKESQLSPVYFICGHHSDLVWRRTYSEADQVRKEQTEHLIRIAEENPEFCFFFEQSETPGRLPEFHKRLKALWKRGQVDFVGGMCIPDLNMCSGETFLKSLLYGRKDYEEMFGVKTEVACLSDAFGMPIQVPQVLSLCGYKYLVPGRMANAPEDLNLRTPFIWSSANNRSVLVANISGGVVDNSYVCNVPVCYDSKNQMRRDLERFVSNLDYGLVIFHKEEGFIPEDICRYVEQVNRKGMREVRFSTLHNFFKDVESGNYPRYVGEFNPTFTGCYSTRIGTKQKMRKAEIQLRRAEILAAAAGKELDAEDINRELFRCAFHDSLCGCCTDAAQASIEEKFSRIFEFTGKACDPGKKGKSFFIANTSSVKGTQLVCSRQAPAGIQSEKIDGNYYFYADLPAVGGKKFQVGASDDVKKKVKGNVIKTDYLTVDFSGKYPSINGKYDVFGKEFGAIRIRADYGSMWTERYKNPILSDEYCQEGKYTITEGTLFYHAASEGFINVKEPKMYGHTGAPWSGFQSLSWKKDFYFPKKDDYFFLKLTLDYKGFGSKVFVEFPHKLNPFEMERTDSVPFGSISRKPYFEVDSKYESTAKLLNPRAYSLANGDWPTLDWTDFSDNDSALAIANSGTPGCWAAQNLIRFSLLRSGISVEDGSIYPDPGSYDNGVHEYWFAFRAHDALDLEKAAELGNILNRMPTESAELPEGEWLSWNKGNIALSSAERVGSELILRFYEYCGKRCENCLSGDWVNGHEIHEITPVGEVVSPVKNGIISFAPFEIKTLAVTLKKIKQKD